MPLEKINDEAFSQGFAGKGVAVMPANGEVLSPFDGAITALFPTKHAFSITSDNGVELLAHIGLDTRN